MGCFSWQKAKIKAEQSEQHGPKINNMFSNKPLVLPDPDYLPGEQSPAGSVSSPQIFRNRSGKRDSVNGPSTASRLTQTTRGALNGLHFEGEAHSQGVGNSTPSNPLPLSVTYLTSLVQKDVSPHRYSPSYVPFSARLSLHASSDGSPQRHMENSVPFSAPLPFRPPFDASSTVDSPGRSDFSPHRHSTDSVPFSAPLPSRPLGDTNALVPPSVHPPPLCCVVSSVAALEPKRIVPQSEKKMFGGRPARLPKPQAGGHPLPLPATRDDGEAHIISVGAGTHSPRADFLPTSNKGKDGFGALNSTFRAMSMGANLMNAKPLPPPAFTTESRTAVRCFQYEELAHAFVPEFCLSEGTFGNAYVVRVVDAEKKQVDVAVFCPAAKVLQGLKEWIAEVNWLARLQDPHLCKLVGYCAEDGPGMDGEILRTSKRLLVYEYLSRGSLQKHLNTRVSKSPLDWATKMKIALDVAQGLAYLHDKAPFQVICRDLTSSSIQLDKGFRAKLSGFGLTRSGPEGEKAQASPLIGPYVAPESGQRGHVTIKSNVWSFGVILLELLMGRQHMDTSLPREQQNLVQLTKPFLRDESKLSHIIDPELRGKSNAKGVLKVAHLAFNCLNQEPALRPNLSEAVDLLKHVQIDEDATYGYLKKSRSLSQSQTSPLSQCTPVSYSRSVSQAATKYDTIQSSSQERDGQGLGPEQGLDSPQVPSIPVSYLRRRATMVSGEYHSNEFQPNLQDEQGSQVSGAPVRQVSQEAVKNLVDNPPSECKLQQPEPLSRPTRLSVNSRLSCAPALSFEPPLVREAF